MSYILDPSKAIADIDSMSVKEFTMLPVGSQIPNEKNPISVSIVLTGGLGRIYIENFGNRFVEDTIQVDAESVFYINKEDQKNLKGILSKWHTISPPLRYVDFGEKAVILEDSDNFIVMPKGKRDLKFTLPAG